MGKSIKPILLLCLLFTIVAFLGGLRLGRKIEHIDQVYVPPTPIAPSPAATAAPEAVNETGFNTFISDGCGITFLFPSHLEELEISSSEAQLLSKTNSILVTCEQQTIEGIESTLGETTKKDTITLDSIAATRYDLTTKTLVVLTTHPTSKSALAIQMDSEVAPLVIKTLEFTE